MADNLTMPFHPMTDTNITWLLRHIDFGNVHFKILPPLSKAFPLRL